MRLRDHFRNFYTFNRRERSGVLFLMFLVFGVIVVTYTWSAMYEMPEADHEAFFREVARFEASLVVEPKPQKRERESKSGIWEEPNQPQQRFPFNPNKLPAETWRKLGLKDWQIRNIHKYESKGGQFRKPTDLLKMYGMDSAVVEQLMPFIRIPVDTTNQFHEEKRPRVRSTREAIVVDVNRADSGTLVQVKGIGPYFASRIVKMRQALGGYVNLEQLTSIYRLDDSVLQKLKPHLKLDAISLSRININLANYESLVKHPYIRPNLARVIVAYREQHGPYANVERVRDTDLVNDELYRKLAPYLTTE